MSVINIKAGKQDDIRPNRLDNMTLRKEETEILALKHAHQDNQYNPSFIKAAHTPEPHVQIYGLSCYFY